MTSGRKPVFVANTPVTVDPVTGQPSPLAQVTLYQDTWDTHIIPGHPEMADKAGLIQEILARPTIVCECSSEPGRVFFVDETVRSPSGRSVVTVAVDPNDAVVCTAFYNRSFQPGPVIWQAGVKK